MREDKEREQYLFLLFGLIPVIWLALLIAPFIEGGLPEVLLHTDEIFANPFEISLCDNSLRMCLIGIFIYAMSIGIYYSTRRNYRRGEEHGSAKWGSAKEVNKKYSQKPPEANKLLTEHVRLGLDGKKHRRNLNVLVCGGSGAGKTRFYCKPNILQANTSFVVLDPKG